MCIYIYIYHLEFRVYGLVKASILATCTGPGASGLE